MVASSIDPTENQHPGLHSFAAFISLFDGPYGWVSVALNVGSSELVSSLHPVCQDIAKSQSQRVAGDGLNILQAKDTDMFLRSWWSKLEIKVSEYTKFYSLGIPCFS